MAVPPPPRLINIQNNSYHELFPPPATNQQMATWLGPEYQISNPLDRAVPTTQMYQHDATRQYLPATIPPGPFAIKTTGQFLGHLDDTRQKTVIRERTWFIVNHGDYDRFDSTDGRTFRSVADQIAANITLHQLQQTAHWSLSHVAVGQNSNSVMTQTVRKLMASTNNDCRGCMRDACKTVWNRASTAFKSQLSQQAQIPGRLVQIMLSYLLHDPAQAPGKVKFILGDRLRPHFDVDALYATPNGIPNIHEVIDNAGQTRDLVKILKEWIEYSCAHMLVEVFNHTITRRRTTKESSRMLNANFKHIANVYADRPLLEQFVSHFPYM